MTPAQKRMALVYLRDVVLDDLRNFQIHADDAELYRAMRAVVRALRGVKATKTERKR